MDWKTGIDLLITMLPFQNGSKLLGGWFKLESEYSEGQWAQKQPLYSKDPEVT